MPKEWGVTLPNISKYVKAVPPNHQELLKNLQELAKNWSYVDKCGVIKQLKGIYVDLGNMANNGVPFVAKGQPDFYIPLKALELDKADTLVKALVAKVESNKPIVEQDALALFPTCETA